MDAELAGQRRLQLGCLAEQLRDAAQLGLLPVRPPPRVAVPEVTSVPPKIERRSP